MGILDQAKGMLGGGQGSGVQGVLVQQLTGLLSKPGGLSNLTQSFQQQGLGDVLQSWFGSGENKPISPSQVEQVLGRNKVDSMAQKAGVSTADAKSELSGIMPKIMDRLSPDGQVPDEGQIGSRLSSLKGMFGK